jgi:hypothetical protein
MGWTKEVWRHQVASRLLEIGSIELQKDLWLAKLPGYQSDFTEAVNGLESCGIPDFLDNFLEHGFLENSQAQQIRQLDSLIDQTGEYSNPLEYEQLWKSGLWQEISKLSIAILNDGFVDDLTRPKSPYQTWYSKYILQYQKP